MSADAMPLCGSSFLCGFMPGSILASHRHQHSNIPSGVEAELRVHQSAFVDESLNGSWFGCVPGVHQDMCGVQPKPMAVLSMSREWAPAGPPPPTPGSNRAKHIHGNADKLQPYRRQLVQRALSVLCPGNSASFVDELGANPDTSPGLALALSTPGVCQLSIRLALRAHCANLGLASPGYFNLGDWLIEHS